MAPPGVAMVPSYGTCLPLRWTSTFISSQVFRVTRYIPTVPNTAPSLACPVDAFCHRSCSMMGSNPGVLLFRCLLYTSPSPRDA
eukprot:2250215-Heterocapsa_arctica.AAC.1